MQGITNISDSFTKAKNQNRAALMPFITLGYPDIDVSIDIIANLAISGVDLFELGIPFSDPIADGPTIQNASQIALENGVTIRSSLEMVARIRQKGVKKPLLLMGYLNPIMRYGINDFIRDAHAVGVDGFILADLPPEESNLIKTGCENLGLALVFLASPTTSIKRLQFIASQTTGFLYLVTLKGVTGGRDSLPSDYLNLIDNARQFTNIPLSVGFGISSKEQVHTAALKSDGVIIGSALIESIRNSDNPVQSSIDFISSIYGGLSRQ